MIRRWIASLALISAGAWAAAGSSVEFETTLGNFTVELNQGKAPITVDNFLRYVEDGSYKGSIFHRIIPGFMAQGGGFDAEMKRLDTYAPIVNEANNGLTNDKATIAMARTQNPDSATRQFFINLVDNHFLNYGERPPGYAVFGVVTKGFDTIELMAEQKTGQMGYMKNVPVDPIIITNVTYIPAPETETPAVDETKPDATDSAGDLSATTASEQPATQTSEQDSSKLPTADSNTTSSAETTESAAPISENKETLSSLSVEDQALRTAIEETLRQNSQVLSSMNETKSQSSVNTQ